MMAMIVGRTLSMARAACNERPVAALRPGLLRIQTGGAGGKPWECVRRGGSHGAARLCGGGAKAAGALQWGERGATTCKMGEHAMRAQRATEGRDFALRRLVGMLRTRLALGSLTFRLAASLSVPSASDSTTGCGGVRELERTRCSAPAVKCARF